MMGPFPNLVTKSGALQQLKRNHGIKMGRLKLSFSYLCEAFNEVSQTEIIFELALTQTIDVLNIGNCLTFQRMTFPEMNCMVTAIEPLEQNFKQAHFREQSPLTISDNPNEPNGWFHIPSFQFNFFLNPQLNLVSFLEVVVSN